MAALIVYASTGSWEGGRGSPSATGERSRPREPCTSELNRSSSVPPFPGRPSRDRAQCFAVIRPERAGFGLRRRRATGCARRAIDDGRRCSIRGGLGGAEDGGISLLPHHEKRRQLGGRANAAVVASSSGTGESSEAAPAADGANPRRNVDDRGDQRLHLLRTYGPSERVDHRAVSHCRVGLNSRWW